MTVVGVVCGICPKKNQKTSVPKKARQQPSWDGVSQLGLTDQFLWAMASIAIWVKPTAA